MKTFPKQYYRLYRDCLFFYNRRVWISSVLRFLNSVNKVDEATRSLTTEKMVEIPKRQLLSLNKVI